LHSSHSCFGSLPGRRAHSLLSKNAPCGSSAGNLALRGGAQSADAKIFNEMLKKAGATAAVELDEGPYGRGVFATQDCMQGDVLISVPLDKCILANRSSDAEEIERVLGRPISDPAMVTAVTWDVRLAVALLAACGKVSREGAAPPASRRHRRPRVHDNPADSVQGWSSKSSGSTTFACSPSGAPSRSRCACTRSAPHCRDPFRTLLPPGHGRFLRACSSTRTRTRL
jgi:hypothetical protein